MGVGNMGSWHNSLEVYISLVGGPFSPGKGCVKKLLGWNDGCTQAHMSEVFDLLDVQSQNRIRQGGTSDSPCLAAKIIQDLYDIYIRTGLWLIMDQFWRINYIKIWSICPSMMFSLNQVVVVWRRGP
jgi:hypothetical protein